MARAIHKGHVYSKDILDSAQLILLEMHEQPERSFAINGRPSVTEFGKKLQKEHPHMSLTETLHYFWAFEGHDTEGPILDLETGEEK